MKKTALIVAGGQVEAELLRREAQKLRASGGLLIAADPACGEELLAALAACVPSARRIGEVCDSSGEARILLR